MEVIRSTKNARISEYRLICRNGREGLVPLEGARLIIDAMESGVELKDVFATQAFLMSENGIKVSSFLKISGREVIFISEDVSDSMGQTSTPQGIYALARWNSIPFNEFKVFEDVVNAGLDLVVVLDGVSDPGNVGTLVRTSAAMGVGAMLLGSQSATFTNSKVLRSSMGAVFKMKCVESENLVDDLNILKDYGYNIVVADRNGQSIEGYSFKYPMVLVVGGEAFGVSKEVRDVGLCDAIISIPIKENVESLNAAVAGSIIIYMASKGVN